MTDANRLAAAFDRIEGDVSSLRADAAAIKATMPTRRFVLAIALVAPAAALIAVLFGVF